MTNVLAANAVVPRKIDTQYFLKATKQGFPIDNQIPRTYQVYTGTGNQTITYNGSNEIRIFGPTLTGPLTINFGPLRRLTDMVGRILTINIIGSTNQTVTLSSSPAFMVINGTSLQQFTHVIPGDNISKSITVYFHSSSYINVDYGAALSSVVPSLAPVATTLTLEYPYGTDVSVNLPIFHLPDSTLYNLTYNDIEATKVGRISDFSGGTVSGPGTQTTNLLYQPAPRRTDNTIIHGYLTEAATLQHKISFTLILQPILYNVYDQEFFIGCNSDSSNTMYDPFFDSFSSPQALDVNGNNVLTTADPRAIAVDIADSLLFYVADSVSTTTVFWESYTTGEAGQLVDVASLPSPYWPSGGIIIDIAFDEVEHTLLILSDRQTSNLLGIPIKPYRNSTPGVIEMGPMVISESIDFGVKPTSIAVCPITRNVYFGCKTTASTTDIMRCLPFPFTATSTFINTHPTITAGDIALTFTAVGTLLALYEDTKELYRVSNGGGIFSPTDPNDLVALYVLPSYHRSLSPNCYGWQQG
jgi:hypothetical protein